MLAKVSLHVISLSWLKIQKCGTDLHREFIMFIHYQIFNHNLIIYLDILFEYLFKQLI